MSAASSDRHIFEAVEACSGTAGYNVDLHAFIVAGAVDVSIGEMTEELFEDVVRDFPPTQPWTQELPVNETFSADKLVKIGQENMMPPRIRVLTTEESAIARATKEAQKLDKLVSRAAAEFAAPEVVDYSDLTALHHKRDSKKIAAWTSVENRSAVPAGFVGRVQVRMEPVNVEMIYDFAKRTACRRAVHKTRGSLLKDLVYLLDRVVPGSKSEGIGQIRVLYVHADKGTGLETRWMTGLNHLPTVLPQEICAWFSHELSAGVPRNKMARGAFAFGSLVKCIVRQGLNIVDGDQVRCFIQNRWLKQDPATREAQFPTYAKYMHNPDGVCKWMADKERVSVGEAKVCAMLLRPPGQDCFLCRSSSLLEQSGTTYPRIILIAIGEHSHGGWYNRVTLGRLPINMRRSGSSSAQISAPILWSLAVLCATFLLA